MNLQQEINQAVEILRAGGLVGMPTETVYGLAGDARNPEVVSKIFTAKQRPQTHPLIVHLADPDQLTEWAREIPDAAYRLALAFWPGPLTLILKKQPQVLDSVTGGQDSVGIRIPRHPMAQALLQAFGSGLVAPSANRFTRISPTTAEAVYAELGESVNMILEGGACEVGLESTIVDMSVEKPVILRPGMISAEQISEVVGFAVPVRRQDHPGATRAPGMHHLHYAPSTPVELQITVGCINRAASLQHDEQPAVLLCHSDIDITPSAGLQTIRMPANPADYAHELYQTLRAVDAGNFKRIIIEAVPDAAEWDAVRDRLQKACGR